MGEIADDHFASLDDERAQGYRRPWRPSQSLHRRQHLRWFTVEVTKHIDSDDMRLSARFEATVFASSPADAMKRLRPEFPHWHFRVIDA